MRTLILSDIHLGSRNCNAQGLLQLLDKERFDRLLLNGDTINSVNLRKLRKEHWQILSRFREIGKSRELILIRGNHDQEEVGIRGQGSEVSAVAVESEVAEFAIGNGTHFSDPSRLPPDTDLADPFALASSKVLPALLETPMIEECCIDIGEREYLVMHGDRFDPTLRYPVVTEMAEWCYQLSQKINKKLAKWLKKRSKRWGGLLDYIRRQTVAHAKEREYPGIITGHTHYPDDMHSDGVHYLNSGCWTDNPCGYLIVENGRIRLRFFP